MPVVVLCETETVVYSAGTDLCSVKLKLMRNNYCKDLDTTMDAYYNYMYIIPYP